MRKVLPVSASAPNSPTKNNNKGLSISLFAIITKDVFNLSLMILIGQDVIVFV
jgi:hypothetical protein